MSKTSTDWLPGPRLNDCRISGATMGTRYSARFAAPPQADLGGLAAALEAAVTAVDRQMSNWRADSDLMRLNQAAPDRWVPIPTELASVLSRALEIGRETGNAFNIGVGDLVAAWGFGPPAARAPQRPAAVPCPPAHQLLELDLPNGRARKQGPVALDLCGIAKGFGVDEMARVLDAQGLGAWLVGIDGELRTRGSRPDGSAWAIALEAPRDDLRTAMGVVELADAAVATSGDYRHWTWVDGQRVSHTMDPRRGAPLCGELAAVTVIAGRCMDADAYATALMVAGEGDGLRLARQLGLDALFVSREGDGFRAVGTGALGNGPGAPRPAG